MKKYKSFSLCAILAVLACFCPLNGQADISWKQVDSIISDSETVTIKQTVYVSGDRFAIETTDGMKIIIDLGTGMMTTIDTNEKTYYTVSLNELETMRESMRQETDTLIEEALRDMPADQREVMRKQLKEEMAKAESADEASDEPEWNEYKPLGKTDVISGYTAEGYKAEGENGGIYEIWCTKELDMSELRDFFDTASSTDILDDLGRNYSSFPLGFPLKTVTTEDGERTESLVTTVTFDTIPGNVFSIPDGYIPMESMER